MAIIWSWEPSNLVIPITALVRFCFLWSWTGVFFQYVCSCKYDSSVTHTLIHHQMLQQVVQNCPLFSLPVTYRIWLLYIVIICNTYCCQIISGQNANYNQYCTLWLSLGLPLSSNLLLECSVEWVRVLEVVECRKFWTCRFCIGFTSAW